MYWRPYPRCGEGEDWPSAPIQAVAMKCKVANTLHPLRPTLCGRQVWPLRGFTYRIGGLTNSLSQKKTIEILISDWLTSLGREESITSQVPKRRKTVEV